jgi:PfaB family protein
MNIAVTGLASIIPQGKGVECLNHMIYEGLPVRGRLNEKYYDAAYLCSTLIEELESPFFADKKTILEGAEVKNIFLSKDEALDVPVSLKDNSIRLNSLKDALLETSKHLAANKSPVRIFLLEVKKDLKEAAQANFFLSQGFSEEPNQELNAQSIAHYALAIQLESLDDVLEQEKPFMALIEDISWRKVKVSGEDIHDDLEHLLFNSGISSKDVDVFELAKHKLNERQQTFSALADNFKAVECDESEAEDLNTALSSVATSFSYQEEQLEFISLFKAVLQCYHRYISGVPQWKNKHADLAWATSNFYIAAQSKFWFVADQQVPRRCLIHSLSDEMVFHALVSDKGVGLERYSHYFSYACPHLIPIAGDDLAEFQVSFNQLGKDLNDCHSRIQLRRLAKRYYQKLLDAEDAIDIKQYRAVLLAEDKESLLSEIELLEKGMEGIFSGNEKQEIKTPKGSYFTLEPLGEEGKLAFVFPGLGSSYIGLGQKIFQLFPSIFKESFRFTKNVGEELQEKVLYPRTQDALSFREKRQRDMEIVTNLKDLGKTDTTYSSICAHVMTDVFQLKPDMAFGYSMGEANMMTALDVWQNPTQLEERFKESDIFKNKLYGQLDTVKQFWNIDKSQGPENLWGTFTLKASKEQVEKCIKKKKLEKVYLTLNNTEDNVVIAGNPLSCMTLVQALNCRAIPMGFVPAIHCEITAEEYEGIAELYSMPTTNSCSTKLYSSSCYLPVPVRQKAIAYAIAKCFCEPVDFPRLVNKVYQDGARIFLEAGAGRTCSTWIDKILNEKKHVIVPLNAKGTEDSLTFARVMAKLFCHKVDVSLHPLYENVM